MRPGAIISNPAPMKHWIRIEAVIQSLQYNTMIREVSREVKKNEMEAIMTLEEKRIDYLYDLLHKLEGKDHESEAALRWAIFELERVFCR